MFAASVFIAIVNFFEYVIWLTERKNKINKKEPFFSNRKLFLNIDNPYFEGMVNRIYPPELQLTKLISLIPKPHFWVCIYLFQTDLFNLKFMIWAMTLILI